MANTPFKLRSGNSTNFKNMGSSKVTRHVVEKSPVGPVTNDPMNRFFPPPPPVEKKSTPKTDPNVSVTNPNIVAEPVTTNVNMPNPNLEVGPPDDKSTVKDVLTLPINMYTNPNKAIRTTQNMFNKGKELINKGKKKVGKFLNKTI